MGSRGALHDLIRRAENVWWDNCSEEDRRKKEEEDKLDGFTKLKKRTAASLRELRSNIAERDELLEQAPNTPAGVQLSASIRHGLKDARDDLERLEIFYQKEKKKNKHPSDEEQDELDLKKEVIDSLRTHVEDLQKQDKLRFAANAETRAALMAGGADQMQQDGAEVGEGDGPPRKRKFSLSEMEGLEVETQDGFKQLLVKDQKIDQALDEISVGVQGLKQLAVDMGEEVEKQTFMIEQIEEKVDRTQEHLNTINNKLSTTLKKTRKADKIILDFICCLIFLGICLIIFKMVKSVIDTKKEKDAEDQGSS